MAYEKLNLQDGQVLDAAALAHMEDGIENAVPPPDGNFNQLVTDGAGNVGWAPRLAYQYSESSISWDGTTDGRTVVTIPINENINLNFYKVSDTFWESEKLIGSYVTVNGAEALGLPQTFEITSDMITSPEAAAATMIQVSPSSVFPVILSVSDGFDEYEQGVYVLLAKAEELQSLFHIPAEKDVFAKTIATAPIYKTIPQEYLPNNTKRMTVVINMDESDNYVASATYDEIASAITSGQTVMCAYGQKAFQLVNSPALSDIAPMDSIPNHSFICVDNSGTYATLYWIEINANNSVSFTTKKLTFDT